MVTSYSFSWGSPNSQLMIPPNEIAKCLLIFSSHLLTISKLLGDIRSPSCLKSYIAPMKSTMEELQMVSLQEVKSCEEKGRKGGETGSTFPCCGCSSWPKALAGRCKQPETLNQPLLLHSSRMPGHCCLGQRLYFIKVLLGGYPGWMQPTKSTKSVHDPR